MYAARFEGGVLDGRTIDVASLAVFRYASRAAADPVPMASKPPGSKFDGYELYSDDPGDVRYIHDARRSSRATAQEDKR